jgi:methylamine dehydrogenase heavy chain
MDFGGARARKVEQWPLVDAAARKAGWRPGGYQLFALHRSSGRL